MKKYQLTKAYPNSPKEGTIVKQDELGQYVAENPLLIFEKVEIEEYPEFQEEVKEKPNYLITAFRFKDNKVIYEIQKNGLYSEIDEGVFSLNEMMMGELSVEDYTCEIYSVKNYKGEEFTIGDNIKGDGEEFTITSFEIGEHIYGGCYVYGQNKLGNTKVSIELVEKIDKKPIFVSADGKEFFETGQTIKLHGVFIGENVPKSYNKYDKIKHEHVLKQSYHINITNWLWFVDEKLAQEYIDNNKPKYSLVDIENAYDKAMNSEYDGLREIIEELKKTR